MIQVTVGDLASRLGVEYATAAALVKLMVATGGGREAGKRAAAGGRGKPSVIYELNETHTINLSPATSTPEVVTAPAPVSEAA